MKWRSTKDKLPPQHERVLLCRKIDISDYQFGKIEIGFLGGDDRFHLESQKAYILPITPHKESGIITHWAKLPKCPNINE
jgi:hypothetical protein